MRLIPTFFAVLLSTVLMAQPETDIFLFEVKTSGENISLGEGKNITPRKGYDNQPHFTPDSKTILYVASSSNGQTDVFQYDIAAGSARQLTRSKRRSEYSPKVMPGGESFSAVVVERDSTQRIWQYPLEKEAPGKVLMPKVKNVGYYTWYHKKKLAVFVLPQPFLLQRVHKKKQKPKTIAENIGRCILMQGDTDSLTFVQKDSVNHWYIKSWSPRTRQVKVLAETLPGEEDFCWTPDGRLMMGNGEQLYIRDPYADDTWREVATPGVGRFYRATMSPDGRYIALVVYR